jgi:hypothetical protein
MTRTREHPASRSTSMVCAILATSARYTLGPPSTTTGVRPPTPSTSGASLPGIRPVGTVKSASRILVTGASAIPWCSDNSTNPSGSCTDPGTTSAPQVS